MKPTSGCHIGQGSLVAIPASGMREKVEFYSLGSFLKQVRPAASAHIPLYLLHFIASKLT